MRENLHELSDDPRVARLLQDVVEHFLRFSNPQAEPVTRGPSRSLQVFGFSLSTGLAARRLSLPGKGSGFPQEALDRLIGSSWEERIMRIVRWAAGIGIMAAVAIPAVAWSRAPGDERGEHAERAERVARALQGKTFSLVDAIRAAEAQTGGTAIESEVEVEDGQAMVEVVILNLNAGRKPELFEVEVDGATNKVVEIESTDDDGGGGDHEGDDEGEEDDDA